MIRKVIKIFGTIFIIIGLVSLIFSFLYVTKTKITKGVIVEILQRQKGVTYEKTQKGTEYPCKLKISFKDSQGETQDFLTAGERSPCGVIPFFPYYKIGDEVNVRYDPQKILSPALSSLSEQYGVSIFIFLGIGMIIFSNKIKNKGRKNLRRTEVN